MPSDEGDTTAAAPKAGNPQAPPPAAVSTPSPSCSRLSVANDKVGPDAAEDRPNTPEVSSKHWRKIRSAVTALAAFRSRRVKAADFESIRLCGEGGSGLVYLVKLRNTSMFFALKVQRKVDLEAKEKRIRRALIEREVLVTCAHPFVCNLYTAFQDTRHLYLLMDFCAGGDLNSFIRDVVKRPLTEEEARFYVSEIVAALEWVHLHGYVYRDLKPENVLIHASGHIRLGDFGTAERGSIRCCDLPNDRVTREEVECVLVENRTQTIDTGATSDPSPTPPTATGLTVSAAKLSGGDGYSQYSPGDEDEADADSPGDLTGDLDQTLGHNNIVVEIDPLLEETSASTSVGPRKPAAAAIAAAATGGVMETPADVFVSGAPCVDMSVTTGELGCGAARSSGASEPAAAVGGCICPRRCRCRGWKRWSRRPAETSARFPMGSFSRGRGSVKLNVVLDSQTFIGTADFMAPEMVTGKEQQGTAMDWWALGVMLYEITLGTLPFHSRLVQSNSEVFRSIVRSELTFPRRHKLGRAAVDFIEQLLRKDPSERLGERKGVGEIKRHPFFRSVHWALIANRTPPYVVSGPDSPGWEESVSSAPPGRSSDKMATWTWMVTKEGLRPPTPKTRKAAEARAHLEDESVSDLQDSPLGATSGRIPVAELNKLGEELSASARAKAIRGETTAGAGDDAVSAAAAGKGGGGLRADGSGNTAAALGNGGSRSASSGDTGGVGGIQGEARERIRSASSSKEGNMSTAAAVTSSAAGAAAGAGAGAGAEVGAGAGAAAVAIVIDEERSAQVGKAKFDGYDFNTLRKVGSTPLGRSGHATPKLFSKRSSDAGSYSSNVSSAPRGSHGRSA